MRKTNKKLRLDGETIRTLAGARLEHARGGILKSTFCGSEEPGFCNAPNTFYACSNTCGSFAECDITYGNASCVPQ